MSSEPAVDVHRVSKVFTLGLTGKRDAIPTIIRRRVRHPFAARRGRERFTALDDVSFEVQPGEVVGIIGRNGAGKSTLLKILSHITFPTSGHVDIVGRVGSLLEVGTGFHPELTGTENVYLNGTILGMSKREIDARLDEIVAFAEVDKFLDTPVKRYSSGMRVRLAFAVAAHLEPEVLIVDEVLSVGDAGFQARCVEKMRSIAGEEGRTVLYVSHNLVTVENLCDRALLLASGRLVFDGSPPEAVAKYLYSFPQGSRGATPGVFDLALADRGGDALDSVFRLLELRPGGGLPSETVRMGDRLQMAITVEGLAERREALVIVRVLTAANQPVMRMTSSMVPIRAALPRSPQESIVLDIPSLMLVPGEYVIDLQIKDGGHDVDHLRRAATFSVVPADVLGSGYRYSSHDGLVVVPWDWEVRPLERVSEPSAP